MDPVAAVLRAGGIARYRELRDAVSRHEIEKALAAGTLVRVGRGLYALPHASEHVRAAASLAGALGGLSAAMYWGWKVKFPPERPQVIVPRGRNISPARRAGIDARWGLLSPADLERGALGQAATALDCARTLPFDAALAVVDSALRDGVSRGTLLIACQSLPRVGRSRAIRVIELADARAANPFESVLRATLIGVRGLKLEPQVWVGNVGRADLLDRERRLVVEGDSFEFHASRESLLRDMERYNGFQAEGYVVARFGWEHAMFQSGYVRQAVIGLLAAQRRSVRTRKA